MSRDWETGQGEGQDGWIEPNTRQSEKKLCSNVQVTLAGSGGSPSNKTIPYVLPKLCWSGSKP